MREAVAGLEGDLDALRAMVDLHAGRLDDTAAALDMQEDQLMQLWAAVEALQAAPVQFDAADLWLAIGNLEDRTGANEAAIAELRALLLQEDGAGDLAALQDSIAALEAAMAAADADRASFSSSLIELVERVNALEGDPDIIIALQGDLVLIGDRLTDLESRVTALETELALAQETLADHEERLTHLEQRLDPDRAPFYINLALYGSTPDRGLLAQATVGHDALFGNIGARLALELGLGDAPMSVSGGATYRMSFDRTDGYAGLGFGASFEDTGTHLFGELALGMNWRVARNFGLFLEGRYRAYLDGSGDGLAGIGGGVQFRF